MMIEDEELLSHHRRQDDRYALSLVYTLTERVSAIIRRFDDYSQEQKEIQGNIKVKLDNHEALVIKTLNSWHWFTVIITLLSSSIAGIGVYGYNQFALIRDSVIVHHAEDAGKTVRQEERNLIFDKRITKLEGGKNAN
jgi:hypothetical protein